METLVLFRRIRVSPFHVDELEIQKGSVVPTPCDRNYPLEPRSEDPRFTAGLWIDTVKVLLDHGYPELTGLDIVELQQALFRFLYRTMTPIEVLREIEASAPKPEPGS
jgi:hypothetical protein